MRECDLSKKGLKKNRGQLVERKAVQPVKLFLWRLRISRLVQFDSESGIWPVIFLERHYEATCRLNTAGDSGVKTNSECTCSVTINWVCLLLSFGYRKGCTHPTATPSMPAGLPWTLGTLAQISFPLLLQAKHTPRNRAQGASELHQIKPISRGDRIPWGG